MSDIPTGNTMEVVLDRMERASTFASNGVHFVTEKVVSDDEARTYISAARAMLDEALRALDAVTAG